MFAVEHFDVKFISGEVSALGGLVLFKKMMDGMGGFQAIQSWRLRMSGSSRDYAPEQLLEQIIVSIGAWLNGPAIRHHAIRKVRSATLIN